MDDRKKQIPIIDIFAGPGGLGEGFSAFRDTSGKRPFRIGLSIEKDPTAHKTLRLRSFFRQFESTNVPANYFLRLQGKLTTDELFTLHPQAAEAATVESWNATLGDASITPFEQVRKRISLALSGRDKWILIGGPPCQAYSLVGRARNMGKEGYTLAKDPKARLYLEYLQIIADFWPAVFVMENVKGLLSSKIDNELVFDKIREDLSDPSVAIQKHGRSRTKTKRHTYTLHALAIDGVVTKPSDYLIRSENFGVPQARHRIIIVGVRDDMDAKRLPKLEEQDAPTVGEMLKDLPPLRSGLSKEPDSGDKWAEAVLEICGARSIEAMGSSADARVRKGLSSMRARQNDMSGLDRGAEFVPGSPKVPKPLSDWLIDDRLKGFCNHTTRSHIRADLHRYLFASLYASDHTNSPVMSNYPKVLLPKHKNVASAIEHSHFADRFRVQLRDRYSTTITSHISKDGHYYIHYDPTQCRSLTVREAARLQTFPDSYFFEGMRTAQYIQVGNAVPPFLATQIASCVYELMR